MVELRKSLFSWFGFDSDVPAERTNFAPAIALSGAMFALPVLLLLPVDSDRAIPLAFLPVIMLSGKIIRPTTRRELGLLVWALTAMVISAFASDNLARALVMTASVTWVIAGAFAARNLAHSPPAVRLVLAGIVAGAMIGLILVCCGIGANRMLFPLYWSARLFGAHQFIGCVAALGLLAREDLPRRKQALLLLGSLAVWTGLAWSGGRAAAMGLGVMIVLFFWRGDRRERKILIRWVPLLSILALLLSYSLGNPYSQLGWWDALDRTVSASGLEAVTSERSKFWTVVWHQIKISPWIGHGADAYLFIHPRQNGNQPHNFALQWLLEFGLLGTIPLCLVLLRGLRGLFDSPAVIAHGTRNLNAWAASAVAAAIVYGLLEGVFYHMIIFMPVAVILGFALGHRLPPDRATRILPMPLPFRVGLLTGLALLLVHNWLNLMLLRAHNVQPDSPVARVLRVFPSITYGLQNWTTAWAQTQPLVAMEWIKWAQTVSTEQNIFHANAAEIYLKKKDFRAAEAELLQCLEKGPEIERTDLMNLITQVRASAAAQEASATLSPRS